MPRSEKSEIRKLIVNKFSYIPNKIIQSKYGIMNSTFFVDKKYIVQKSKNIDPYLKPQNKISFLTNTNSKNFEHFLFYDKLLKYKICKYIEGCAFESKYLNKIYVKKIIGLLSELHKEDQKNIQKYDVFHNLTKIKETLKIKDVIKNENLIIADAKKIFKSFPLVVSHNDVILNNFILNKETNSLNLIDFDFLGLNYEIFDFISFIEENDLEQNNISKIYWNEIKKKFKINNSEIKILCCFFSIYWFYWAKYLYIKTKKNDFKKIMNIKLKKLNQYYIE